MVKVLNLDGQLFTFNIFSTVASIAAPVLGGLLQKDAAKKAAAGQVEAARIAAEAAEFDPYNVQGLFGQAIFDQDAGTARFDPSQFTSGITGALQDPVQGLIGQRQTDIGRLAQQGATGFLSQALTTDPFDVAQQRFGQLESILSPGRERQREALESRLLRQGRLGSTGGSLQQEGLETAIEQSRQQGLFDIFNQAQAQQQSQIGLGQQLGLFGQQQQEVGLGQALNRLKALGDIEAQQRASIDLGGVLGGRQSAAGAQAGAFGLQGAQSDAAAQLGAAQGLSSAIGNIGSAIGNIPSGGTVTGSGAFSGMPIDTSRGYPVIPRSAFP